MVKANTIPQVRSVPASTVAAARQGSLGVKKVSRIDVKQAYWTDARVQQACKIALKCLAVAAVAAAVALLIFLPGAPLAFVGTALIAGVFGKIALTSAFIIKSKLILSALIIGIPTAIAGAVAKRFTPIEPKA